MFDGAVAQAQAQVTAPTLFGRTGGAMLLMMAIDLFFVAMLLFSGFLVLNLGLLSKRRSDHIGKPAQGDLQTLKSTVWPREPEGKPTPEEMERRSREGRAARVVGRIGEGVRHAIHDIATVEGSVTASEAREAGGIGSSEPLPTSEEELPHPSKKVS